MAMPAGITTRTLTFGAAFDLINGTDMSMQVLVDPSRSMVWRATGSPGIAIQQTFDAGDGLQHEMDVPITDQVGWGDGNGNLIDVSGGKQSHLYRVTIKYLRNNRVVLTSESKWIAVPLGDGSPIDLDDLIPASGAGGATIFIPDTWDARISELEALITTTGSFIGSQISTNGTPAEVAVAAKIATAIQSFGLTQIPIGSFVNAGETLVSDGSGTGNNSTIINRAVVTLNALWAVDKRPRQIFFPDGTYNLSDSGAIPGYTTRYAVRWRSGAGIATSSRRGVIFVSPPTSGTFAAAEVASWSNIEDVFCDPHVVDGRLQNNATYTSKFKGWFIQGLKNSYFDDVCVINTFSTGFGCDYIQNSTITGYANNCGRGITEKGIDPLTTSGGSGFGIGTGRFEIEDFTLDVVANNCGFHGVFIETQGVEPLLHSKGSRIRASVTGNYVGFRDCGADGLQAQITSGGNKYAEILHDKTVLNDVLGINGTVTLDVTDGLGDGIVFGAASSLGEYTFRGKIRDMVGKGVRQKTGGVIPNRLTLDLDISGCGGDAVAIDSASKDLTLSVRAWNNTGYGLALRGSTLTATDLTLERCDFRSGGVLVEQAIGGDLLISSTTRGVSLDKPSVLTAAWASTTTASLTWQAGIAPGVTDYVVQYRLLGDTAWTTFTHTASPATSITVTGLTALAPYEFQVASLRGAAQSAFCPAVQYVQVNLAAPTYADNFAVTVDTSLDGRTLPDGSSTAKAWAVPSGAFTADAAQQRVRVTAGSAAQSHATIAAATNVFLEVLVPYVNTPSGSRRPSLVARQADINNTMYVAPFTDGRWSISKRLASANTRLFTGPPSVSGDVLRWSVFGNRFSLWVNGVYAGTVIDANTLASNTNIGIGGVFTTDPQSRMDNFKAWV